MKHDVITQTQFKITEDAIKNSSTNVIKSDNVVIEMNADRFERLAASFGMLNPDFLKRQNLIIKMDASKR